MLMSLLLLACRAPGEPPSGTFVGNPGETTARLAACDDSIEIASAEAMIDFVEAVSCGGDITQEITEDVRLDLLSDNRIVLPPGQWCALGVYVETIALFGGFADVSEFEITLEPGFIDMYADAEFAIDGDAFILELADEGWLSGEVMRGLDWDEEGLIIDAEDSLALLLSDTIVARSALFLDDGDGALSDAERGVGAVAYGTAREGDVSTDTGRDEGFTSSDGGGGCGGGVSVALLLPLAIGLRRRVG